MRKVYDLQMKIGETTIPNIKIDLISRDEIPRLLIGLQYIYSNKETRTKVFDILTEIIPPKTNITNGRPGMDLWKILVLGTLRLNCNWDYDKLKEIADNHKKVREMLGHGIFDENFVYPLQTIKDNVSLFTKKTLDKISQIVVKAGHNLINNKKEEEELELKGKCDSFVVETDVHFPTDINLLFDAIRKVISLLAVLCSQFEITGWRQYLKNISSIKRHFNKVRKLKHSTSKNEKKKAEKKFIIAQAHQLYIDLVLKFIKKAKETIKELQEIEGVNEKKIEEIEKYISHAERQIDQIKRRVIEDKKIPHSEKIFSIFEEHTEWIKKGKAGVFVELGLRVSVVEDQYRFILNHLVMEKETDDKVAVSLTQETKKKFSNLRSCSFDKGFYSPDNKEKLGTILDGVILPKKGKLSLANKEEEYSEEFVQLRREHSAVESAINALENHGLDKCPDHGIDGFKSYVALAVVARNIHILGNIVREKELKQQKRREKYNKTWRENRA